MIAHIYLQTHLYDLNTPILLLILHFPYNKIHVHNHYEDFPFHPDKVLKDLIKIFHPTLLPDYELKYFDKLVE